MEKKKLIEIIRKYFASKPINKVILIGSYAKNNFTRKSDVDLIVFPEKPLSLMTFCKLITELEENLGIKVDMTTSKGISPYLLPLISKEMQTIYEKV